MPTLLQLKLKFVIGQLPAAHVHLGAPLLLGLAHVSDASPIFNLSFDSYLPDCSLSLKTLPNSVLKTAIYDQKLFKIQPSHVCGCSTNNSNGQMLYLILIQYF